MAIHITLLVGFRNRIAVLFSWAWMYLTRRRHSLLIVAASARQPAQRPAERRASVA
jgi:NADH dehydrogenase